MTFLEAQQELARRFNADFTAITNGTHDLLALTDLKSWINLAILRVWDYARWIFTEDAVYTETTIDAETAEEYYDYPDNWISDSIFLLRVENKEGKMKIYDKIRYEDFIKYLEENEEGKDKIFTDHNRFYFINSNAYDGVAGRKIEVWGKKRAIQLSNNTDLLPFSPDTDQEENSGNETIIEIARSIALASEKFKKPNESIQAENRAYAMLEVIAKREKEEQAGYQTKDRELFDNPPII